MKIRRRFKGWRHKMGIGLYSALWNICDKLTKKYCAYKYDDYEDNNYNNYQEKFVFGVLSNDSKRTDVHFYSMNDLTVWYDRRTTRYHLSVETTLYFEGETPAERRMGEALYLKGLLDRFTDFMERKGYNTNHMMSITLENISAPSEASSLERLYYNFKIFCRGFYQIAEDELEAEELKRIR